MIKVRVPATSANLGPGFDTFGMALDLYNYITVTPNHHSNKITVETLGETIKILNNPKYNLTCVSAKKVFDYLKYKPQGLHFKIENNVPVSRGLGSSAAAIVGGLYAANAVCGYPLSKEELLKMACEIEGHPDNVAPAIYGGFVASNQKKNGTCYSVKFMPPERLKFVVAIPEFHLSTNAVRKAIPEEIKREDAVYNMQCATVLMGSLMQDDLATFSRVVDDRIHQPYRFPYIKGSRKVLKAAKEAGAIGEAISGAGPTLMAFANADDGCEEDIAKAMETTWQQMGVNCKTHILSQDKSGVIIL